MVSAEETSNFTFEVFKSISIWVAEIFLFIKMAEKVNNHKLDLVSGLIFDKIAGSRKYKQI